jgi:hypothetical protein
MSTLLEILESLCAGHGRPTPVICSVGTDAAAKGQSCLFTASGRNLAQRYVVEVGTKCNSKFFCLFLMSLYYVAFIQLKMASQNVDHIQCKIA